MPMEFSARWQSAWKRCKRRLMRLQIVDYQLIAKNSACVSTSSYLTDLSAKGPYPRVLTSQAKQLG
jgi:hypothetical protein